MMSSQMTARTKLKRTRKGAVFESKQIHSFQPIELPGSINFTLSHVRPDRKAPMVRGVYSTATQLRKHLLHVPRGMDASCVIPKVFFQLRLGWDTVETRVGDKVPHCARYDLNFALRPTRRAMKRFQNGM